MVLNRETILSAQDVVYEEVEVPEWGGKVRVKALSGKERDEYESSLVSSRGKDMQVNLLNARAKLLCLCIVDENNNRLFSNADVEKLGEKSAAALDRIFKVAQKLSGLGEEDIKTLTENLD